MKPIIAFDLDGTIITSDASERAHQTWFDVLGMLLNDPSASKLAGKSDYFPDVMMLMERLTGLNKTDSFDKMVMTKHARSLFQLLYLAEIRKEGEKAFVPDIVDMIIELKQGCRLALITSTPEDVVLPALDIGKIKKLFDYIYRSPITSEPSKSELLRKFIKEVGKPALYVGNEEKDAIACKELGIKFALAKWAKHDEAAEHLAAFNLTTPKQLKGIIGLI